MNMILSGEIISKQIRQEIKDHVEKLPSEPGLAVVLVGNDPISQTYIRMKQLASQSVGIKFMLHKLANTLSEAELIHYIEKLNHDNSVDGILIQLPLPPQINPLNILTTINPDKDVDGFHPVNLGNLLIGADKGFIPCTPLGIKTLLDRYELSIEGKHVVIVGRSTIVGKPLAALLMQNKKGFNATVTVAHSQTRHINEITKKADILVAALGKPRYIQSDMVKDQAIVIDVGINQEKDTTAKKGYRLVGDVDFDHVKEKCLAITPVPKGIGPMTVAMLLLNTLKSYQRRH